MNFILNYLNKTATLPEMTLSNSYLDSAIILTSVSTHSLIIIYVFFFPHRRQRAGVSSQLHTLLKDSLAIFGIFYLLIFYLEGNLKSKMPEPADMFTLVLVNIKQ